MLRTRWRRDERGASTVEFALIMPILLVLVFGIIQYAWYFYAMQAGTSAVGDATRRLAVGDCQSSGQLQTFLKNKLGGASEGSSSDITTSVVYKNDDGSAATAPGQIGGSVELTATYSTLNLHFPFIPVPGGGSITRSVTARVEDLEATTGGCS